MVRKIVKMLLIPEKDPWMPSFYMCGGCAHAIKLKDVEEHARDVHKADGVELFERAVDANKG